tara:strand:+ start:253 stop:645 length:393 start_codon:yes stop_codon:yes gene_type:complete
MIYDIVKYSIILLSLDSIYLKIAGPKFVKMTEKIQGETFQIRVEFAVIVYIVLVLAWFNFIYPEIKTNKLKDLVIKAFILGLCIYATYDFTNLAILNNYRLDLAILDSVWGGTLFALSTFLFVQIKKYIT